MKYYIGYSTNTENRYRSSSGGIGSELIRYLMDREYGTAMTFVFNKEECRYEPKLIFDYEDYNNCGSIYQDTDTIGFIKNNVNRIKNGIVITCMPCQVKPIRSILNRNNIKHFIISLCCSGQTTVQGTWCYYKLLGIKKEDVVHLQYRGNGWPSGIQIQLKNGEVIKKDNYTYPWTLMHKSLLFLPQRCLHCTIKTSPDADISLADPWLKEYIENDNIGNSVVICDEVGNNVIEEMIKNSLVCMQDVNEDTYIESQLGTIENKKESAQYKKFNKLVGKMGDEASLYKRVVTSSTSFLKMHIEILKITKLICRKLKWY